MTKQRMLIIEDDSAILIGLKKTFNGISFSVTTARDGHDGYTIAKESYFDIIILDISLPGMNGFDICRDLRAGGCTSGIIMLTAQAAEADKIEGFGLGADDYLAKPFSVAELKARVKVLTEKKNVLKKITEHDSRLMKEINKAQLVQARMFPSSMPIRLGWDFAGACVSAGEVGGDYYDIFEISNDKIIIALGDVSGKGMGAALLMSAVHAMIHSKAPQLDSHLDTLAKELNQYLLSTSSPESFITLFLACIDTSTGTLNYVNCGHPSPMLITESGSTIQRLDEGGLMLGILADCRAAVGSCRMLPGQCLIAYSDGISEARNHSGKLYGEQGIIHFLSHTKNRSATGLTQTLIKSASRHAGRDVGEDDMTVLIVARRGL